MTATLQSMSKNGLDWFLLTSKLLQWLQTVEVDVKRTWRRHQRENRLIQLLRREPLWVRALTHDPVTMASCFCRMESEISSSFTFTIGPSDELCLSNTSVNLWLRQRNYIRARRVILQGVLPSNETESFAKPTWHVGICTCVDEQRPCMKWSHNQYFRGNIFLKPFVAFCGLCSGGSDPVFLSPMNAFCEQGVHSVCHFGVFFLISAEASSCKNLRNSRRRRLHHIHRCTEYDNDMYDE